MERLTKEQVTAQPWKYTASQYQAAMGVHAPWIAEISPTQYAHLSKTGKRQYDAKRNAEWDASAQCKRDWRELVIAAHDAGQFDPRDASQEARDTIAHEARRRQDANDEERLQQALRDNKITDLSRVNVGDRVYSLLAGYGTIVKKNRVSVMVQIEKSGRTWKCSLGELQWLHYNELKAQIA